MNLKNTGKKDLKSKRILEIFFLGNEQNLFFKIRKALFFLFAMNVASSVILLILILFYIAFFAFSFGPVVWVILSEIYPTRIRGRAMGIATLTLWTGTWFVGQFTPFLLETVKAHGTFW